MYIHSITMAISYSSKNSNIITISMNQKLKSVPRLSRGLIPCITTRVQTFNSCISRPDVCQRLITCRKKAKHINDTDSLRIKATFSCGANRTHETGWRSGLRFCIMPGLPMYLVHELNVTIELNTLHNRNC